VGAWLTDVEIALLHRPMAEPVQWTTQRPGGTVSRCRDCNEPVKNLAGGVKSMSPLNREPGSDHSILSMRLVDSSESDDARIRAKCHASPAGAGR
jgi:hypothetical protein